jgi:hypothetical protein
VRNFLAHSLTHGRRLVSNYQPPAVLCSTDV